MRRIWSCVSAVPLEATTFFDTLLVHLNHIGIAFNQVAVIGFSDGLFGKENAIQHFALVVNLAFGRVEVFSLFLVVGEDTPSKTQYPSAHRVYGEHHAPFEAVELTVTIDDGEPCFSKNSN